MLAPKKVAPKSKCTDIPALVVDDDDMNVFMMRELLKAQDYASDSSLNE